MSELADLKKSLAREVAMTFIGDFYRWGGEDPSGFDCSGLTTEVLKSVGLIDRGERLTAAGFYNRFAQYKTDMPVLGCLVFWGKALSSDLSYPDEHGRPLYVARGDSRVTTDKKFYITHIEFVIDGYHTIGASGGGSNTLTVADAIRDNAFVKCRPISRADKWVVMVNPFSLFEQFPD